MVGGRDINHRFVSGQKSDFLRRLCVGVGRVEFLDRGVWDRVLMGCF